MAERLENRAERVVRRRRVRRVVDGPVGVAQAEVREAPVAPDPRQRLRRPRRHAASRRTRLRQVVVGLVEQSQPR